MRYSALDGSSEYEDPGQENRGWLRRSRENPIWPSIWFGQPIIEIVHVKRDTEFVLPTTIRGVRGRSSQFDKLVWMPGKIRVGEPQP